MTEETAYQVKVEVFEGPFDLLLKAIDEGKIDIYHVSIAQITNSYLEYWKREEPNLLTASDFLYMAALLIEIKSRSLLPAREEIVAADEMAGVEESLLAHIQEYQVYKQVALGLKERKEIFERVYGRHEGESVETEPFLVQVSLKDLVVAFQKVYREAADREKIITIKAEEITLEQRIAEIKQLLEGRREGLPFIDLFIRKTRLEIVITFLGILELAKQNYLVITQDRRFGTILIFMKELYVNGTREN
ncbi:MAG: segregation/condensation protein A [Candidatus Margulisbacteria bacterium]|nr:segregation/condensation protein A [Candidatus Margulisiibacteriota bacterium]